MQDLSYDNRDPVFEVAGLRMAVQVFTFENVYGLDPAACTLVKDQDGARLKCHGLTWAGGQRVARGTVNLVASRDASAVRFSIEATAEKTIRCVKLILKGLSDGPLVSLRPTREQPIPPDGLLLRYPDGFNSLETPLAIQKLDRGYRYFRSLDNRVREIRMTFLHRSEGLEVELIFEEDATRMSRHVTVPTWEVGLVSAPGDAFERHLRARERDLGLQRWESREDVPAWMHEVSLIASIHGQHWTGYIFNDYPTILEKIQWLAERVEPKRILAYLPGWEGRYYWRYGAYAPDPAMGGEAGFARLCEGARKLGVRLMPMFGANAASRNVENFEAWATPAMTSSPGGWGSTGGVDWDGARHYDHGWGVLLNPGAPTWQNRLVDQVGGLADRYGFDAAFLDISCVWFNDPRFHYGDGMIDLARRLREDRPNLLVAGEGWYDGVGRATPLVQLGHRDGSQHFHGRAHPPFFGRYNRSFGHLCQGDPGRGSTGVHELGQNESTRMPFCREHIPTLTIVEDTLEQPSEQALAIIADANRYAEVFLGAMNDVVTT